MTNTLIHNFKTYFRIFTVLCIFGAFSSTLYQEEALARIHSALTQLSQDPTSVFSKQSPDKYISYLTLSKLSANLDIVQSITNNIIINTTSSNDLKLSIMYYIDKKQIIIGIHEYTNGRRIKASYISSRMTHIKLIQYNNI